MTYGNSICFRFGGSSWGVYKGDGIVSLYEEERLRVRSRQKVPTW